MSCAHPWLILLTVFVTLEIFNKKLFSSKLRNDFFFNQCISVARSDTKFFAVAAIKFSCIALPP